MSGTETAKPESTHGKIPFPPPEYFHGTPDYMEHRPMKGDPDLPLDLYVAIKREGASPEGYDWAGDYAYGVFWRGEDGARREVEGTVTGIWEEAYEKAQAATIEADSRFMKGTVLASRFNDRKVAQKAPSQKVKAESPAQSQKKFSEQARAMGGAARRAPAAPVK